MNKHQNLTCFEIPTGLVSPRRQETSIIWRYYYAKEYKQIKPFLLKDLTKPVHKCDKSLMS